MKKRIISSLLVVCLVIIAFFGIGDLSQPVTADKKTTFSIVEITNKEKDSSDIWYLYDGFDKTKKVKELSEQLVKTSDKKIKKELVSLISMSFVDYKYDFKEYAYELNEQGEYEVDGYNDKDSVFRPAVKGYIEGINKQGEIVKKPVYTKYYTMYKKLLKERPERCGKVRASIKEQNSKVDFVYTVKESNLKKALKDKSVSIKTSNNILVDDINRADLVYLDDDATLSQDVANRIFEMVKDRKLFCFFNKDASLVTKEKLTVAEKLKLLLSLGYPNSISALLSIVSGNDEITDWVGSFDSFASSDNTKGLADTYLKYVTNQTDSEKRAKEVLALGINNESLSEDVVSHNVVSVDNFLTTTKINSSNANSETKETDLYEIYKELFHQKEQKNNKTSINLLEVEPCNAFFTDDEWRLKLSGKLPYVDLTKNLNVTRMQSKEFASYKGNLNEEFDYVYIGSKYDTLSHESATTSETKWITYNREDNGGSVCYSLSALGCNEKKTSFILPFDFNDCKDSDRIIDKDFRNYSVNDVRIYTDINGKSYYNLTWIPYLGDSSKNNYCSGVNIKDNYLIDDNGKACEKSKLKLVGYAHLTMNDTTFSFNIDEGYVILPNLKVYINKKPYTMRLMTNINNFSGTSITNNYLVKGGVLGLLADEKSHSLIDVFNMVQETRWQLWKRNQYCDYSSVKFNDYADLSIADNFKCFPNDFDKYTKKSKYIKDYSFSGDSNEKIKFSAYKNTDENDLKVTDVAITRRVYYALDDNQTKRDHNFNEDSSEGKTFYFVNFSKNAGYNTNKKLFTDQELQDLGFRVDKSVDYDKDNTPIYYVFDDKNKHVGVVRKQFIESTKLFRIYILPVIEGETTKIPTVYNDSTMNGTLYNHIGDLFETKSAKQRVSGNDISKKNLDDLENYKGTILGSEEFFTDTNELEETVFDKDSYVYQLFKDNKVKNILDTKEKDFAKVKDDLQITNVNNDNENLSFDFIYKSNNNGRLKSKLYIDFNSDGLCDISIDSFSITDEKGNIANENNIAPNVNYHVVTNFTDEQLAKLHGYVRWKFDVNDLQIQDGYSYQLSKKLNIKVLQVGKNKLSLDKDLLNLENYEFYFTYKPVSDLKNIKIDKSTIVDETAKEKIRLNDYNILVLTDDVDIKQIKSLVNFFNDSGKIVIYTKDSLSNQKTNIVDLFRVTLNQDRFGSYATNNYTDKLTKKNAKDALSERFILQNVDTSKNKYYIYNGITKDNLSGYLANKTKKVKQINQGQILSYPYEISDYNGLTLESEDFQYNVQNEKTNVWLTLGNQVKDSKSLYDINYGDTYNNAYCYNTTKSIYVGLNGVNWNKDEQKLFINALVFAYRPDASLPDVYLLNEYSDKVDAESATAYIDYSMQAEYSELKNNDTDKNIKRDLEPLSIISLDGKQLLELDFYIKEKDIVNDTDVTLESKMSILSNVEPKAVYANKVNGTVVDNKVQFFVDITDLDNDIEKGNNGVILRTKVGGKEKSYTVLLAKRDLLDIR